jgi:uroporphyrinogen-III decarboxylase
MKVLPELAELGLDCICPFERPPGGDVTDLRQVRRVLAERVAFNGNVHTVETLIRGAPADVRREVAEIMEAFAGSPRLIVGTGDQVGAVAP